MSYNIQWLKQQYKINNKIDYLFFWGHTPKLKNSIDKSCFSQWYPSAFNVKGVLYRTAEHWMMAKKAILFSDDTQLQTILSVESPAEAKKAGRAVKNFDPKLWEENAFNYVIEGNKHKFSQHSALKQFLLQTENAVLVEASPFDAIWGIGMKEYETDPLKWKGTNLLGFALMKVREEIKEQYEK